MSVLEQFSNDAVPSTSSAPDETANEADRVPPDPSVCVIRPEGVADERLNQIQIVKNSLNRVKLYVLCDQRIWDDRGTGHVAIVQYPANPTAWCLIVRLESNETNVLESPVCRDTIYQRQQGTLIVWSESDSCDLALSFQEKSGCTLIWDRICQIQGRDPDVEDDGDVDDQQSDSSSNGSTTVGPAISLPVCSIATINEIEQIISANMGSASAREKMANTLQQQNYLPRITEIFKMCEDLEHHQLNLFYSIAKNLFLLNSNMMLNELLSDKNFKDVVGMLEYDPAAPEPRKHREFLFEKSRFREVLPIKTQDLKDKIQLTFRIQYVQDVCLPAPSLFEENLLTCLNSQLFFLRAEIVTQIISDRELMRQLFDELRCPATSTSRRRDLTKFLRELCMFVHSLQNSAAGGREQFFKTVMSYDMVSVIDLCISNDLASTRNACLEIISMMVEYNPVLMREFLLRQAKLIPEDSTDEILMNKIVRLIITDKDPELSMGNAIAVVIKNLLDSESIVTVASASRMPRLLLDKGSASKADKVDFFIMFYHRVIDTLARPICENIEDHKIIKDDYYKANQMALLMELMSFCVENHVQSMRSYIIQKDLLSYIGMHLRSRHSFMVLSALRVLRQVIQQKDEQYNRYIVDKKIIDYIIDCFVANGDRYNLINSAILDFFDFIKHDNIFSLMSYTIKTHYETVLKDVKYVQLFEQMRLRHQAMENCRADLTEKAVTFTNENKKPALNSQWAREKVYDDDELFFNGDGEDDEDTEPPACENDSQRKQAPQRKTGVEPMYPSVVKRKLNSDEEGVGSIFGGNVSPNISGPNRISKIVIKMSDRPDTASPPPQNVDEEEESTPIVPPIQFGVGSISPLATTSVSASDVGGGTDSQNSPDSKRPRLDNAAGSRRALFNQSRSISTTNPPSEAGDVEFDDPIVMKGTRPSLVNYDLSDDEDEEGEENGKSAEESEEK